MFIFFTDAQRYVATPPITHRHKLLRCVNSQISSDGIHQCVLENPADEPSLFLTVWNCTRGNPTSSGAPMTNVRYPPQDVSHPASMRAGPTRIPTARKAIRRTPTERSVRHAHSSLQQRPASFRHAQWRLRPHWHGDSRRPSCKFTAKYALIHRVVSER
jgi:hypothetical protein